jgi:hypothetical protein
MIAVDSSSMIAFLSGGGDGTDVTALESAPSSIPASRGDRVVKRPAASRLAQTADSHCSRACNP